MPRSIVFVCQHGYGVGHLVRTCAIADELVTNHGACATVFSGGRPVTELGTPLHAQLVQLPPLEFEALTATNRLSLRSLEKDRTLEEVECERAQMLLGAIEALQPDVIVIEYFPFAPERFGSTLTPLLNQVRQLEKNPTMICSLRTFPTDPTQATPQETRVLLKSHFHLVLHHTDSNVYAKEDLGANFLEATHNFPVVTTGLVCRPRSRLPISADEEHLLLTVGGGRDGADYLSAWLLSLANSEWQNDRIRVVCGPLMPNDHVARVMQWHGKGNISVEQSVSSAAMEGLMSRAAAIICMGGYNTLTETLAAGKPALAFARAGYIEQEKHVRLLADKGLVLEGSLEDPPNTVLEKLNALKTFCPQFQVDVFGAKKSAQVIMNVCEGTGKIETHRNPEKETYQVDSSNAN